MHGKVSQSWSGTKIMQCSKICEHLTKALTESKTTKQLQHDNCGPLHSGWSHSQTAFFAPRSSQLPISFHLSSLEWWSTAWFKAWHDQSLHPTLCDNDQLKAAQIGYLRGCMFTRAFLNSQSSGHDITLTIFEPKWLGSVPDYLSVRQKVV